MCTRSVDTGWALAVPTTSTAASGCSRRRGLALSCYACPCASQGGCLPRGGWLLGLASSLTLVQVGHGQCLPGLVIAAVPKQGRIPPGKGGLASSKASGDVDGSHCKPDPLIPLVGLEKQIRK